MAQSTSATRNAMSLRSFKKLIGWFELPRDGDVTTRSAGCDLRSGSNAGSLGPNRNIGNLRLDCDLSHGRNVDNPSRHWLQTWL